jgi:hypothetical protein
MNPQGKMEEADKLMKKATKLCNPSLLSMRIKPDWEAACPMLERAALCYKVRRLHLQPPIARRRQPGPASTRADVHGMHAGARHTKPHSPHSASAAPRPSARAAPADRTAPQQAGAMERALHAYERASTAQEKQGSHWHAAKHMETAGEICRQLQEWEQLGNYYQRAAQLYQEAGRASTGAPPPPAARRARPAARRCSGPRMAAAHQRARRPSPWRAGADALARAAKALEEKEPKMSYDLYVQVGRLGGGRAPRLASCSCQGTPQRRRRLLQPAA